MSNTCNMQCNTCENHDSENKCCKIKSKEEFSKINFTKEKCTDYIISTKLVMF